MSNITIHDWIPGGTSQFFQLVVINPLLTASELIVLKVRQEVAEHNEQQYKRCNGLGEVNKIEETLNTCLINGKKRRVDVDALIVAALNGFESNSFVLLVDERQVHELNEVIDISREPRITFIRLVPLVGG
jgi:hypothetical protein